jgi:chaperonin cofactor prefoldin
MPTWQRWGLGIAATVVAGLLIGGFHDYMRVRDDVQTVVRAGGYDSVLAISREIERLKTQVEELRANIRERGGRFTQEDGDRLRREFNEKIERVDHRIEVLEQRVSDLMARRAP